MSRSSRGGDDTALLALGGVLLFLSFVVVPAYLMTLEHEERMRGVAPVDSRVEGGR